MYSINNLETVFDVMAYTTSALRESGYSDSEIEDYVSSALELSCNFDIIELSKEWIEECNNLHADVEPTNSSDDTWRDSYYSQFWDDDGERYEADDYTYDYLTGMRRKKESWEYDNAVDDVESDEEAYEGFSTCKNYRWDSSTDEDDDDYDDWKVGSYYESMKREDDPLYGEPSYDPFNDPDNEDF